MRATLVLSAASGFYANPGGELLLEGLDYRIRSGKIVLHEHGTRCLPGKSRAARKVRRMLLSGGVPSCESKLEYPLLGGVECPLLAYNPVVVPAPLEVSSLIQSALYYYRVYNDREKLKRHIKPYVSGSCSLLVSHWWRVLRDERLNNIFVRITRVEHVEAGVAPITVVSRSGISMRRLRCHLGSTSFTVRYEVIMKGVSAEELAEALQLYSEAQVATCRRVAEELGVTLPRPPLGRLSVKIGAFAWPLNSIVVLARYMGLLSGAVFETLMDVRKRCGYGGWPPAGLYAAIIEPMGLVEPGWVRLELEE